MIGFILCSRYSILLDTKPEFNLLVITYAEYTNSDDKIS